MSACEEQDACASNVSCNEDESRSDPDRQAHDRHTVQTQAAERQVKGVIATTAWKSYLDKFPDIVKEAHCRAGWRSGKHAVLIEFSTHPYLSKVLANFYSILAPLGWDFIIVHGVDNAQLVRDCTQDCDRTNDVSTPCPESACPASVQTVCIDVEHIIRSLDDKDKRYLTKFKGSEKLFAYNKILTGPAFWQQLLDCGCEHALIYQTDAVLLRGDGLHHFLQYDYVGAPWSACMRHDGPDRKGRSGKAVGNGGLSMRRTRTFLALASRHDWNHVNEDKYFASLLSRPDSCARVCGAYTASALSLETFYGHPRPLGMHKPIMAQVSHETVSWLLEQAGAGADAPRVRFRFFDAAVYSKRVGVALHSLEEAAVHFAKACSEQLLESVQTWDESTLATLDDCVDRGWPAGSAPHIVDHVLYFSQLGAERPKRGAADDALSAILHWVEAGKSMGCCLCAGASAAAASEHHAATREVCRRVTDPADAPEPLYFDWRVYARQHPVRQFDHRYDALRHFYETHCRDARTPGVKVVVQDESTVQRVAAFYDGSLKACDVIDWQLYLFRHTDARSVLRKSSWSMVGAVRDWFTRGRNKGLHILLHDLVPWRGSAVAAGLSGRMRYILCRPCGGLNDALNQVAICVTLAEAHGYALVVDTQHHRSYFPMPFDDLFELRNVYVRVDTRPSADTMRALDSMRAYPPCLEGSLHGKLSQSVNCDAERAIRGEDRAGFYAAHVQHTHHVLVHSKYGGGHRAANMIGRRCLCLSDRFAAKHAESWDGFVRAVAGCQPYDAVHVRNTDRKTEGYDAYVREWLRSAPRDGAGRAALLLCTDSEEALCNCKAMFGDSALNPTGARLLTTADMCGGSQYFGGAKARSIHADIRERGVHDETTDTYVLQIMKDLYAMTRSVKLHVFRVGGFADLANFLHSHVADADFFFRAAENKQARLCLLQR